MKSIRVKNLHCISDTKVIPLKGINLLVGANSSGKSSILRLFPLLKQGLEVKKRGPLLWYGEDVDFGTFKNTCKKGENYIQLEFCIDLSFADLRYRMYSSNRFGGIKKGEYYVSIKIESKENIDYVSELKIIFADQEIEIILNDHNTIDKIIINKTDYSSFKDEMAVFPWNSLIPRVEFIRKIEEHRFAIIQTYIPKALKTIIQNNCSSRVGADTINNIAYSIECGSLLEVLNSAKFQKRVVSWITSVSKWTIDTREFSKFNDLVLLQYLPRLISAIDSALNDSVKNIHYIGPFRATAQRYYRKQNL